MQILFKQYKIFPIILLFLTGNIYAQNLETFVEYGTAIHAGDYTPLWQVSNQQGLSSIKNNTYIRGGVFYNKTLHSWKGFRLLTVTQFYQVFQMIPQLSLILPLFTSSTCASTFPSLKYIFTLSPASIFFTELTGFPCILST